MKVKLIQDCVVNGKPAKADDVVEVSDADGRYLINSQRAEASDGKKPAADKKDMDKK